MSRGRPRKDLTNVKQPGGKLTARRVVRTDPKYGAIWECECECGGVREVPADVFTLERIRQCEACVSGVHVELYLKGQAGTDPVYDSSLEADWERVYKALSPNQKLLLATILDGRRYQWITEVIPGDDENPAEIQRHNPMLEALDIVLREPDPVWALNYYTERRQEEAAQLLAA